MQIVRFFLTFFDFFFFVKFANGLHVYMAHVSQGMNFVYLWTIGVSRCSAVACLGVVVSGFFVLLGGLPVCLAGSGFSLLSKFSAR